tara:strand:+ start:968 stop:2200 length:1233 start_codon:yes stop_codon:yes gene_type:complete
MKKSKFIIPKQYQYFEHPQIDTDIRVSVLRQLEEDISIYDNGGIYKKLENALAKLFPAKYLLTVSNGTNALYSMFFGSNIGYKDEVIVPAYTFFATATPLFQLGAVPILCDSEENGNISAKDVEKLITPKTKAVVITHMWGIPCDMDSLSKVCKKHNILLLEDCSHAHGAAYKNHVVGTHYSDAAAWSMQGKKLITAGEGGLLATNNKEIFERAVLLGHFNKRAKKEITLDIHKPFTITGFGGNLRIHPLGAAVLLPQLPKFKKQLRERRETAKMLNNAIEKLTGLSNVKTPKSSLPAWYAFPFLFDESKFSVSKDEFVEYLNDIGAIEADIPGSTCPMDKYEIFKKPWLLSKLYSEQKKCFADQEFNFPNAHLFHKKLIKLPTWYGENRKEYAKYYIQALEHTVYKFKK